MCFRAIFRHVTRMNRLLKWTKLCRWRSGRPLAAGPLSPTGMQRRKGRKGRKKANLSSQRQSGPLSDISHLATASIVSITPYAAAHRSAAAVVARARRETASPASRVFSHLLRAPSSVLSFRYDQVLRNMLSMPLAPIPT